MKYLLDTNACVVVLRKRNLKLIHRLQSERGEDISLCSIVTGELFYGAEKSRDPSKTRLDVEAFIAPYVNLPYSEQESREYARIRANLESRGERIGEYDMLPSSRESLNSRSKIGKRLESVMRPGSAFVEVRSCPAESESTGTR